LRRIGATTSATRRGLLLEPLLPGRRGPWGGVAKDNSLFIKAVFWILRIGARGAIYPRMMGTGKTRTGAFAAGATKACGRRGFRRWSLSRTLNG